MSDRGIGRRLTACMFMLAIVLLVSTNLVGPAYAQQSERPGLGSLSVPVSGLPSGVEANVLVRGPGFSERLSGSQVLRDLRPGRYTVNVREVKIAGRHGRVKAGSRAVASKRVLHVDVDGGRTASAPVLYGNIINANVRSLEVIPSTVSGDPENPSGLVIPADTEAPVGTILAAKPSSKLPAGLLHRVTASRPDGDRVEVSLEAAHLAEAFPQIDVDTRVRLTPTGAADGDAEGHAEDDGSGGAEWDPVTVSFGPTEDVWRCQAPPLGVRVSTELSFRMYADVELHILDGFGGPADDPSGRLALVLEGSASAEAFMAKNAGCSATLKLPPVEGWFWIGGIPVPVYTELGVTAAAGVDEDITLTGEAGFFARAGIEFNGSDVTDISTIKPSASGSATGGGKFSFGPLVRLAIGVPKLADIHIDSQFPSMIWKAAIDGNCSIDLGLEAQIGIAFGGYEINKGATIPGMEIFKCPPPPPMPGPPPPPPIRQQVTFDGSPGTAAPPATLGPYTMTPFAPDDRPLNPPEDVADVLGPTGPITFSQPLTHFRVTDWWDTWSHGYTGDVYFREGADSDNVVITLPPGTKAFYFYAEPWNRAQTHAMQATAQNGTTSGPIEVNGDGGAKYFGFYAIGTDLKTITVTDPHQYSEFAIGEFGIAGTMATTTTSLRHSDPTPTDTQRLRNRASTGRGNVRAAR